MSAKPLFKFICVALLSFLMNFSSKAQLVADFNATPLSGCAPFLVSFQDASTGGAVSWEWYLGNSPTAITLQNPQTFYVNAGTYSVTLIVKDAAGNTATKTKQNYITAFAKPIVNFTATPLVGCFNLPVQFTDISTPGSGTITGWSWDFGDGSAPVTTQNPLHTYTSASAFNVSLSITNSNGCSTTFTKTGYIVVGAKPKALFTNSNPTGCTAPEIISFQNQSTGVSLTYEWDFGDAGPGFNPTSTILNPTHSYAAGSYIATLVVKNNLGCTDTVRHPIVIGSVDANFTAPTSGCVNTAINFINTSLPIPTSVLWDFGDGPGAGSTSTLISPTKTYANPGNYTVTLTSFFSGCQDVETRQITIFSKPTTAFSALPLSACKPPLDVNFTNSTIGAVSFEWHFGDGGTSTLENPTHTYTTAGLFTDTLITTNANGCTDTLIRVDYIKIVPPSAIINNLPKSGCAPLSNTFSATVSSVDGITGYEWFSNNVLFSTSPNPTEIFTAGTYDIKLVITSTGGCTDTVVVIAGIRAGIKPTPNFSATPRSVCAFLPVAFTDLSVPVLPSVIDFWDWDFGDGIHSSEQNPLHTYEDTGYFTITLIVGNNGCKDTIKFIDYIYVKPPIALFSVLSNCNSHFSRDFVDQSIGADTWAWNFGDIGSGANNTSNLQSPTHIFSAPGSYTVSLTVTNITTGCEYTKTGNVIIANEFANFTASTLEFCKNNATTFTATSTNANPQIVSYVWDFGDTSPLGTGAVVSHPYTQRGIYTVKLTITDVNGCVDVLTRLNYIKVYGPIANFTPFPSGTCLQTNIAFNDLTTTDGTHPINVWTWTFGDNGSTPVVFSAPPFQHAYANAGVYTIKLLVQDSFGCLDSLTKIDEITVSAPVANFSTLDTASCPGKIINFTNESTGPGITYIWNFGDPLSGVNNTSTLQNPTHIYNQDGNYTVTLTIKDIYNCTSVKTRTQYIKIATPIADFTLNNIFGTCPPINATFLNTSQNGVSYLWTFGDGPATSTSFNTFHTYNAVGVFPATLTVTSAGGCTAVKTQPITVQGPSGSFTYSPLTGCSPLTVNFTTTIVSAFSVDIDYNDGFIGNTPTHNYSLNIINNNLVGDYVPVMILKDAAGCVVPVVGTDTIRVKGVIPNFTQDTLLRCGSGDVVFTSSYLSNDLPILNYTWDFGDLSPTSPLPNPTHNYANAGLYFPKLTMTSQQGCSATKIATVATKVVKVPDISFTQPANRCAPAAIIFNATNLVNPDTSAIVWNWVFTNGTNIFNATGASTSAINFTAAGIYADTVFAVNSSGCRDTATGSIEIYPKPNVDAGQDIVICQGTGQSLLATGAATYVWSPALGLSCTNCPSPLATPNAEKYYYVTGTSSQNCTNIDSVKVGVRFPFKLVASRGDTLCVGQSATLSASNAATYVWSPNAGLNTTTGPTVTAAPNTTTNYMVIGIDDKNCFKDTAYFPVKVFPIPTVSAGLDKVINVGKSVILTPTYSGDVTSVIWTPNTWVVNNTFPSITVKPNQNTEYKVSVSNLGGCTSSDLVNVNVLCDGANFFIPNTFSPNADGANDVFYPRGTGLFTIKQARIFNRWGEEVYAKYSFKANDATQGWDGTFKGQKLLSDVFVYLFEIQCDNNTTLVYKGNITLIK
jgi:gliding motility-associated-like protein